MMKRCKVDKNLIQKLATVFFMQGGGAWRLQGRGRGDRKS
jgi:hypothetical protein